jgi:CcmD family protein
MPALPLDEAGKYVAGAYVVFFTLIVVYVSIIGAKIARIDRELGELVELTAEQDDEPKPEPAGERDGEPVA